MAARSRPLAELLRRPSPTLLGPTLRTPLLTRSIADSSRPNNTPRPARPARPDAGSAIDSLFGGDQANNTGSGAPARPRTNRIFGAEFSAPSARTRSRRPPGLSFDDMAMPEARGGSGGVANKAVDAASALQAQQEKVFESYPRLNPTYGRTVDLDPSRGRDIVRGIGMLGSLMARNKIKNDVNKQRFHERNGLKRKRLNSERWRARFKVGFRHVTARVSELTKKGW